MGSGASTNFPIVRNEVDSCIRVPIQQINVYYKTVADLEDESTLQAAIAMSLEDRLKQMAIEIQALKNENATLLLLNSSQKDNADEFTNAFLSPNLNPIRESVRPFASKLKDSAVNGDAIQSNIYG